MVLYGLIERGLKRYGETGHIERAFVNFVTALLGRYAKDATYDAATRIKARLIQQRLTLHLAPAAPATPAVRAPNAAASAPKGPPRDTMTVSKPSPAPERKQEARDVVAPPPAATTNESGPEEATPVEALEQQLVDRVAKTLTTEAAIAPVAESGISDTLVEFADLKKILIKGLDELLRERHALIRKIDGATGYLKALEADRRRLKEELAKARKHSLVDELTGLPGRDIFVRSLEAEVGRVRRYGFAFALALIDVDGLGEINRTHGREAGDAVLRCYASEILSRFRAYDLISRYGDDEFAVLFPNTQKDGAMRALEKAQKSAASTYVSHDGRSIHLPSFSSVLTVYIQGEKPAQLLKRAAEALDHARSRGQNQIVVSLPSA